MAAFDWKDKEGRKRGIRSSHWSDEASSIITFAGLSGRPPCPYFRRLTPRRMVPNGEDRERGTFPVWSVCVCVQSPVISRPHRILARRWLDTTPHTGCRIKAYHFSVQLSIIISLSSYRTRNFVCVRVGSWMQLWIKLPYNQSSFIWTHLTLYYDY